MGLNIAGYSNIRNIEKFDVNGDWRTCLFSDGYEQSNMPETEGYIKFDYDESKDISFSYSTYDSFRNSLSLKSNGMTEEELWNSNNKNLKFYYIINFSDCEGYIGTSYCKILYDEFTKYEEDIIPLFDNYYKGIYLNLKEIFRLGSNNGFVDFR